MKKAMIELETVAEVRPRGPLVENGVAPGIHGACTMDRHQAKLFDFTRPGM